MFDLKKFLDVDKLKGILGKKSDASDDQGERTENIQADEDKVDAQISQIEKEEGDEENSEPVPFYKDKKKVIRVVVGLGVLYLIYDTFLAEKAPETETVNAPIAQVKKNPNKKKKGATATATEASVATTGTSDAPQEAPTAIATQEAPASQIKEVPISPTPLAEETLAVEQTPIATPEFTVAPITTPEVEMTPQITPEATVDISSGVGEIEHQTKKNDLGSKLTEIVGNEATPAPKKMEVKAYVAPPAYDNLGRGLVYNCKGRHWACVDKDS